MQTRSEVISRLRNSIKEVSSDSKFTNRYLWNVFWTNSQLLLQRESDRARLYNQSDIFETICIKMDKVSPLLCDCLSLPVDCVVYRSRFRLPKIIEGSFGKIYRFISSVDMSNFIILVTPYQYQLKATKYNTEKYAFIHDGYLFAPNTKWSNLIISALFAEEIPKEFKCDCEDSSTDSCGSLLYLGSSIPEWLVAPCIQMSLQELGVPKQIPQDELSNANSNEKQINT